jgi:beta-phosphoglucomutase
MRYHGIVFDMDGTIVDTEHIWGMATQNFLKNRGIKLTDADKKSIQQHAANANLFLNSAALKMLFNLPDDVNTIAQELVTFADMHYAQGLRLIDGFEQFHAKVVTHNLKTALATNAVDSTFHLSKETLSLHRFFGEHLYNISHVDNKTKPDPAIYLHACKQLGLEPAHTVAIEDSAHGVRAAKAAGMFCIGINTAKNPSLLKEADIIIDHYDHIDLAKLLDLKS